MASKVIVTLVSGALLCLSGVASAASTATATQSMSQTGSSRDRGDGSMPAGAGWIVGVLALLAVAGGIVAAASSDSQPESP